MAGRLGEFEQLVLLALLNLGEEGHGPALQITLGGAGREVALGTICKTLHRLEKKGLVQGRWGLPRRQPGGRGKREYLVTSKGLEALRAALTSLRKLYGRTQEHEFVGAREERKVRSGSRGVPFRVDHMSDTITHMPPVKSSHQEGPSSSC